MKETILKLKTMLPAADFIITGSYVLAQYGLMSATSIADLDIILIKPEQATIDTINRFMTDFPAKSTAKLHALKAQEEKIYEPCGTSCGTGITSSFGGKLQAQAVKKESFCQAIFMFDNLKIDIFIEDYFREPVLIIDGIKHTTIPHIILAKKKYGRMKDWMQLRDMANAIFDTNVFTGLLDNGNWKSLMRDDY
jgi:hypothetical protein